MHLHHYLIHALTCLIITGSANLAYADKFEFLSNGNSNVVDPLDSDTPDGEDGVPEYLIIGNNNFILGIGGYGKVVAGEDFGYSDMHADQFIVSSIPVPGNKKSKAFHISPGQTYLFLNLVGLRNTENEVGVYIGANLLGDNYLPSLVAAHVQYRGFKLGYDYPVFSDNSAMPSTIDYQGPNSSTAVQVPEISYSQKFGKNKNMVWQIGMAVPQTSATYGVRTCEVKQYIPDFATAIKFSWGARGSLKIGAILRSLTYRNMATGNDITKAGWGLLLVGKSPIAGGLSAVWNLTGGYGMASNIQDLCELGYDLMPDPSNPNRMKLTGTWGGYCGLQYDFTSKFSVSATYSHVRNYIDKFEDADNSWDSCYRYGQYVAANFFYNIRSNMSTGIEYLYGRRCDMSGGQGHMSRVQTMFQVYF